MRIVTIAACLAGLLSMGASNSDARSRRLVTVFDAVQFVDGPVPQSANAVVTTRGFDEVTVFSEIAAATNPRVFFPMNCWFTTSKTLDPSAAPSLLAISGRITIDGFVYSTGQAALPVAGPYLLCRTDPLSGGIASEVTLKALFT